jgi:hypothetical protein
MHGNGFCNLLCTLPGCTQHFPLGWTADVWARAGGVSPAALCCAPGVALCHGEEEGKGNDVWLWACMTVEERETAGNGMERHRRRQWQCDSENRAAAGSSLE